MLASPCWWFVYDVCLFAVLKTVPLALPWGSPHEGQTALKRLQTNLPWGVQSRDPSGHADFRVGNKAFSPDSEISRSYLKIMWSDAYVFHVFTKRLSCVQQVLTFSVFLYEMFCSKCLRSCALLTLLLHDHVKKKVYNVYNIYLLWNEFFLGVLNHPDLKTRTNQTPLGAVCEWPPLFNNIAK